MKEYDLIVVGSGLFGSIIAFETAKRGKHVLVLEKRNHIGGNCYTRDDSGIAVHTYGAHIFKTSSKEILQYLEQFCTLNNFINSPIANYKGELFNLPFNMNTFYALWKTRTPQEARQKIESQLVAYDFPENLEEYALSTVGRDIYEKLIKGYTEKQWGKPCSQLPVSTMRRIPMRYLYDNNYYNDSFQGVPEGGYTQIFEKLLSNCEVRLNTDYLEAKAALRPLAKIVVFTGTIDSYFGYCYDPLEYRSLRFEETRLQCENYQGVAVMNFTDIDTPYTRIIEHKHFYQMQSEHTVISYEYPCEWDRSMDPYYPMEDKANIDRYQKYAKLAETETGVYFGGRLGEYKYYDMQDTITSALAKIAVWDI